MIPRLVLLSALSLAVLVSGCSLEAKSPRQESAKGEGAQVSSKTKKKKSKSSEDEESSSTRPFEDEKDEDDDEVDDEEPGDDEDTAKEFFLGKLTDHLEEACSQCHAAPRSGVQDPAPLTIFSYRTMRAKIKSDEDDTPFSESSVYKKIRGIDDHSGGDQCSDRESLETCKLIAEWWELETGEDVDLDLSGEPPPLPSEEKPAGELLNITDVGRVTGWAADPADAAQIVTVTAYIDGAEGTGTQVFQGPADQAGFDGDTTGDHAFAFDLPANFRDAVQHTLYVYATIGGASIQLQGSPKQFTALTPSAAGRNFFDNNVAAALNGCTGCHTIAYDQQWESLRAPSPVDGGTATTNTLIRKALGQLNHGGGARCASANASPCNLLQQWWDIEFGN